jgi:hypothetical protein
VYVKAQGIETSSITDYYIKFHNWTGVSVNTSEYTNVIAGEPIENIREQMDYDNSGIIDTMEVNYYSERMGESIDLKYKENEGKEGYVFLMTIDGWTAKFNKAKVYFEDMEGDVTSTASALFAIEMFWDYHKTDVTLESHQIQINIGFVLPDDKTSFKTVKMELPPSWMFNTTDPLWDPTFPYVFYNNDKFFNLTKKDFLENEIVGTFLMDNGLWAIRQHTSPNGNSQNGNGNGKNDDSGEEDDVFMSLSLMEIAAITIAVVAICSIVGVIYYRKRK